MNYKNFLPILICCLILSLNTPTVFAQCPDDINFSTQQELDDFASTYPNCTEIQGKVRLVSIFIEDLNPLAKITSIKGNLELEFLTSLTSLNGLNKLETVGGNLSIVDDGELSSLAGLESLTHIGGLVSIDNNMSLVNFAGLNNLQSIGGSLTIIANESLTSFSGLEKLQKVGSFLSISEITVPDLTGLNNLREVRGSIQIENNDIASLHGLENLCVFDGPLFIQNNFSLQQCEVEAFCDFLAVPANAATITGNGGNCQDRMAIENYCNSNGAFPRTANETCSQILSVDALRRTKLVFTLSPNPTRDAWVQMDLSLEDLQDLQLSVFDINGRLKTAHKIKPASQHDRLEYDFSFLENGMYFVRLEQAGGVAYRKLLIQN